jgi:hypothetical protein
MAAAAVTVAQVDRAELAAIKLRLYQSTYQG